MLLFDIMPGRQCGPTVRVRGRQGAHGWLGDWSGGV